MGRGSGVDDQHGTVDRSTAGPTGVAPPKPVRRSQGERRAETERRVLEAAIRLIAGHGSQQMSLADVGAEAGYSRGIVTHQFGSKEQMLRRLTEYAQDSFGPPGADTTGLERLLVVVDEYLERVFRGEALTQAFLLLWTESLTAQAALRDAFRQRDANFRNTLAGYLEEGIREGTVRSSIDPRSVALVLVGQLRGIGLQMMADPDAATHAVVRREAGQLIRRGLSPDGDR